MRKIKSRPTAIKPCKTADGEWLMVRRERLNLAQSEVAAFLTVQLRRRVDPTRISEYERGARRIQPETRAALDTFLERVESGKKQGLIWQDLLT